MTLKIFWTKSGGRLKCVHCAEGSLLNWIFLPGGPGLGSESLSALTDLLKGRIPGNFWHFDLPGDGSNIGSDSFENWSAALIEGVSSFKHLILVAHSTGGMYALSTPQIENLIEGLVLLDSAPDSGWQRAFASALKDHPIPEEKVTDNETLKALTLLAAPLLFTEEGLEKGKKMLEHLPYNYQSCRWSEEHFDSTYCAKWIPQTLPTLILAGERDRVTPLHLFTDAKNFSRANISIRSIKNGGHFPWIENPEEVALAFQEFHRNIEH